MLAPLAQLSQATKQVYVFELNKCQKNAPGDLHKLERPT